MPKDPKDAARQLRKYYRRLGEGVCPRCAGERDRDDRNLCSSCRAYLRLKSQERYKRLRDENRCYRCGDPKEPSTTGVYCSICRDRNYYRTFIYK